MLQTILITDLTKMSGDRVCIAGISEDLRCIRPVLPNGVRREHLFKNGKLVIRPRARVSFRFYPVPYMPPHIEDVGFEPDSLVFEGMCSETEWQKLLSKSSLRSVQAVYDGFLQAPRWVPPETNTRSLGTLREAKIAAVEINDWKTREYRLSFIEASGRRYDDVAIADLAFRAFADAEAKRHESLQEASVGITQRLLRSHRLFLRLGLTRPWFNPNTGKSECWLQVTGIYTFPDYLSGKSFADF